MKLNTTISIDNMIALGTVICAVILAFGFMKYDIDIIKENLETKVNASELKLSNNLITYKLDVIMQDIEEIKQTLKEKK
jgi:hypothetical protein|tara:strand:+ start:723 stop:959 length:237 start_codon:yes stop_codon:yes gene_type:complete